MRKVIYGVLALGIFFSSVVLSAFAQKRPNEIELYEKIVRVQCTDFNNFKLMVGRGKFEVAIQNNFDSDGPLSISIWLNERKEMLVVVYNKMDGSICIPLIADDIKISF